MARSATVHRCASCGAHSPRWSGRCPACGEWNSLAAEPESPGGDTRQEAGIETPVVPLAAVDPDGGRPLPTGLAEVDRVLSGGLVPGSVTLLYGEPGVGKSTLLAQVLMTVAGSGRRALLVSAEESGPQARVRAQRLGEVPEELLLSVTRDVAAAARAVEDWRPELVVVDSVQTVSRGAGAVAAGSLAEVRACAEVLAEVARSTGAAVILVGHVTKEGTLAGPRVLEHLVDTVVALEGDRHHSLRLLRALKHRHGPTGEIGLLEIGPGGLGEVGDPGRLLLGDRLASVPGSAVAPLLHGRRPLLVEIQALACVGGPGVGRRTAQGLDGTRVSTVLAVLECRAGVVLGETEIFVSVTGGLRVGEPAGDLPLALAVASAAAGVALPADLVAFGEVGLAGELRQVLSPGRRLEEAARLGFRRALVPASTGAASAGVEVIPVSTVAEAVAAVRRMIDEDGGGAAGPLPSTDAGRGGRHGAPVPALVTGTMPRWPRGAANR